MLPYRPCIYMTREFEIRFEFFAVVELPDFSQTHACIKTHVTGHCIRVFSICGSVRAKPTAENKHRINLRNDAINARGTTRPCALSTRRKRQQERDHGD